VYSFTVPNGTYQVRLHFAETYSGNFGVGRRVFDVQIEGVVAIDNLDVFAQVGANTVLVRTVNVTVSDGQINIAFVHGVENPTINAIEVLPTSGPPDDTVPTAPGALAVSGNSSSRVSLQWGAASDNIRVTAYEVSRCSGFGCVRFAPIGSVAALAFNDDTVGSSTTHRYRVRARDAAGNFGPYSNIVESTTPTGPLFLRRINVGGGAYTDAAGNAWSADTGFNAGSASSVSSSTSIVGTSDPAIYRTARWDSNSPP
jgi:hypothetical protein